MERSAARPQPNKNDSQKITKFAKLDALTLASFAPFCSKSLSEKQEIAGKQCGSNTDGRQGSMNVFVKSVFLSVGTTSGMVGGGFWKVDRFVALGRGGAEDQEFCYVLS